MDWRGEGTVISRRPHGEHAVILDILSPEAGRVTGQVWSMDGGFASVRPLVK